PPEPLLRPSLFQSNRYHGPLHPFPTRRPSDLELAPVADKTAALEELRSVIGEDLAAAYKLTDKQQRQNAINAARTKAREHYEALDRKSTRLNSSHVKISYAVFCLKQINTEAGV